MPSLFIHRLSHIFFLVILCFSFLISSCALVKNDTDKTLLTLEKRYQQAKTNYTQLETVSTSGDSRENWLQCAGEFRKIYLTDPKSEYAPNCLFMLGKIYQRMFVRFNNYSDLDESVSYYSDSSSLFPENRLADDSLWALANIYLENLQDPKKATEALNKIVNDHPNGDMLAQASKELKVLSKDHSTPTAIATSTQSTKLTNVLPVKYWSSNDYSRVVINASGPVTFKEQLLEQVGDQPRRLFIDFYNSYIEPQYRFPVPIEDGLLKRIRTGQYSSDTVRVVLDIESISSYQVFSLSDPFRVIIDVRGQNKPDFPAPEPRQPIDQLQPPESAPEKTSSEIIVLRDSKKNPVNSNQKQEQTSTNPLVSSPGKTSIPSTGKTLSLAQQLGLRVKKIVLDPGHGGKDPGAMAYDLKEKDIVLKVAQKLAPILERNLGCKVILTRNSDIFIPLEERTAIANTNDADLFVSLHTNASASINAFGIETYFLNLTTNPEAMRVAAFENATSTHQMSDLQNILSDILKNSKINESSRLARQVHNSLVTGLEKNYSHIKSLGVKQAPFYVLIGAQMPAILVEMAFISNPNDAQHLKNDRFLERIASDISTGIKSYIQNNTAGL
jgi:N-acetylmuramoyl-L-alanine amidase